MKQIKILASVLAAACAPALLPSAQRDVSQGEQYSITPFSLDDSSTHALESLDLAISEMEGERYNAAATYLRRGVSQGDLRCSFVLGLLTLEGMGTERDATLASDLLREAARAGLPAAQATLGLLYASGEGVEEDVEMAAQWYRKAAKGGDPMGQAAFGAVLFLGVGTPKDKVRGYKWTILAADQDHEGAYWNLAAMEARLTLSERLKAHAMADRFKPRSMPESGRFERKSEIRQFQRTIKARLDRCPHKTECLFGAQLGP
jgi:TPR repeat protein